MAQIVVKQLTQEQWKELQCRIDSMQVFQNVYNALSEEAKQEYFAYLRDMISEGIDYQATRDDYNISLDTLEELKEMNDEQKLLFAPEFCFGLLESFVIFYVEECECQAMDYCDENKDGSDSNSIDGSINADTGASNICPHCTLL